MKKQVLAVAAIAGLALGAAVAQGADSKGAGIVGSVHDLSGLNGGASTGYVGTVDPGQRICAYCHSPHHSTQNNQALSADVANLGLDAVTGEGANVAAYKIYAPLWSRTGIDTMTSADYGTYVSQTFDPESAGKVYDPLIGPSRLCLSCHDGSIAIDSYYGQTGTGTATGDEFNGPLGGGGINSIGVAGGYDSFGGTGGLTNDHPIGMRYTDYLNKQDSLSGTDYELNAVTTTFTDTAGAAGKTISSVLYRDPSDTNVNGFVTCASCHDVHNGTAVGNKAPSGAMRGYLLYGSQVSSSFCLTCHKK